MEAMDKGSIHREMAAAWLKKQDDVRGKLTWRRLAKGLKELNFNGPIETIRESEYINRGTSGVISRKSYLLSSSL